MGLGEVRQAENPQAAAKILSHQKAGAVMLTRSTAHQLDLKPLEAPECPVMAGAIDMAIQLLVRCHVEFHT